MRLFEQFSIVAQADATSIFIWVTVLLIVVIALAVGVMWVRKRLSPDEDFHGEGFTLGDLRELHKAGQLSDEEFERAKAKMVESLHAAHARKEAAKAEAAKQRGMT